MSINSLNYYRDFVKMFDDSLCDLFKAMVENPERERDDRGKKTSTKQARGKGFRLSDNPIETEEAQREKENKDVKV